MVAREATKGIDADNLLTGRSCLPTKGRGSNGSGAPRYVGNAVADGKDNRGWLLGHFLAGSNGVRASDAVEVKWGVHPAGDARGSWQTDEQRTTVLLLVKGRFRLHLSPGTLRT